MIGTRGTSTGIAGFAPQLSLALYEALVKQDFAAVLDVHKKLMPLHDLRARRANAIPAVKAALDLLGLRGGPVRLPLRNYGELWGPELWGHHTELWVGS